MQLREYLDVVGINAVTFADRIGVSNPSVYRWIAKDRVPEPEMMRRIYRATHGAVQPNDWVLEVMA